MSLDCRVVHVDSFQEGVKGNVADVLVAVEEEPAENVDRQHTKSRLAVDVHDGEDSLVKNGVSNVFTCLRVCCNLQKEVKQIPFSLSHTWARMSFIVSDALGSPLPSILSSRNILIWRKGSEMPDTSCSGEYPDMIKF